MNTSLYVVGTGPGGAEYLSEKAVSVLSGCDVIIGYTVYADLLRERFPEKEFLTTGMGEEEARCRLAYEETLKGRKAVLICGGDAGIYGLASLMFKIGEEYPKISVEVVPGITAASGGGALLGAPLTDDFAAVSLSDYGTDWETIEKRLLFAAEADFAICIYNPASKNRPEHLKRAADVLLRCLPADRLCGIAENIGRDGQKMRLCTLSELREQKLSMSATVFIGNSMTREINGRMVTPRGYRSDMTENK